MRMAGYAAVGARLFCCNYVCGLKVNAVKGARVLLAGYREQAAINGAESSLHVCALKL